MLDAHVNEPGARTLNMQPHARHKVTRNILISLFLVVCDEGQCGKHDKEVRKLQNKAVACSEEIAT